MKGREGEWLWMSGGCIAGGARREGWREGWMDGGREGGMDGGRGGGRAYIRVLGLLDEVREELPHFSFLAGERADATGRRGRKGREEGKEGEASRTERQKGRKRERKGARKGGREGGREGGRAYLVESSTPSTALVEAIWKVETSMDKGGAAATEGGREGGRGGGRDREYERMP